MNLTIDIARRILEASKQRALELRSPVSIAIVDAGGHLVLFERMMSPYGWATGNISIAKANTAVMFNQSTDAVAQWGSGIPGFASSMVEMTLGKFIMAGAGNLIVSSRSVTTAYANTTNGSSTNADGPAASGHNKLPLRHLCHARSKAGNARSPLSYRIGRLIEHNGCVGLGNTNVTCRPTIGRHHALKKDKMTSRIDNCDAYWAPQLSSALFTRF